MDPKKAKNSLKLLRSRSSDQLWLPAVAVEVEAVVSHVQPVARHVPEGHLAEAELEAVHTFLAAFGRTISWLSEYGLLKTMKDKQIHQLWSKFAIEIKSIVKVN